MDIYISKWWNAGTERIISHLVSRSGCAAVARSGPSPTEDARPRRGDSGADGDERDGQTGTFSEAAGVPPGALVNSRATVKAGSSMGTFIFMTKTAPFRTRPWLMEQRTRPPLLLWPT